MVKKFVVTEFQLFEKKIVSTVKRRGFNGKKKAWFDFKRKMFQRCFNCEKEVCFDGKKKCVSALLLRWSNKVFQR